MELKDLGNMLEKYERGEAIDGEWEQIEIGGIHCSPSYWRDDCWCFGNTVCKGQV